MKNILLLISITSLVQTLPLLGMQPSQKFAIVVSDASPKPVVKQKHTKRNLPPLLLKRPLFVDKDAGALSPREMENGTNSLSCSPSPYQSPRSTASPYLSPRLNPDSATNDSLSLSLSSVSSFERSAHSGMDISSMNSSTESLGRRSPRRIEDFKLVRCPDTLKHACIIPDGHRRNATEKNLPMNCNYAKSAARVLPRVTKDAFEFGLETLTLWLFSPENWNRPDAEVDCLMTNFWVLIDALIPIAHKYEAKISHLGRKDRINEKYNYLLDKLNEAEIATKNYKTRDLAIGLDYGGQDEIVDAVIKINAEQPSFNFAEITKRDISHKIPTFSLKNPIPQLTIRTNSQIKTSGFMAWNTKEFTIFPTRGTAIDLSTKDLVDGFNFFSASKDTTSISSTDNDSTAFQSDESSYTRCPEDLKHIQMIMDGYRNAISEADLQTYIENAANTQQALVIQALSQGVETLSISLFSSEDWERKNREIDILMEHFAQLIDQLLETAHHYKARIIHLGSTDRIKESYTDVAIKLLRAQEETKEYKRHELNLGIDYGGQDDIVYALRKIASEKPGFIFKGITAEDISQNLQVASLRNPSPDLVIGQTTSPGIMCWYAQRFIMFPRPVLNTEVLLEAIKAFSERKRLYGT